MAINEEGIVEVKCRLNEKVIDEPRDGILQQKQLPIGSSVAAVRQATNGFSEPHVSDVSRCVAWIAIVTIRE